MKKALSLILALTLALSMGITAFAEEITPSGDNGSHNVTATYQAGQNGGTVYGVDISWGDMVFTYTDASKGTWSAEDHKYDGGKSAAWTCGTNANIITVTNHSNAPIDVTPSYTKNTGYDDVNMKFSTAKLSLATADNGTDGAAGKATKGIIAVTPSGSLPKNDNTAATTGATIGQITLKLEQGSTSGDTTDAQAIITGVEVQVGDVTYLNGTVPLNANIETVTIIIRGTNVNKYSPYHFVKYTSSSALNYEASWSTDANGTTSATLTIDSFESQTTEFEIQYTNNGSDHYKGSGVKVIYEG